MMATVILSLALAARCSAPTARVGIDAVAAAAAARMESSRNRRRVMFDIEVMDLRIVGFGIQRFWWEGVACFMDFVVVGRTIGSMKFTNKDIGDAPMSLRTIFSA